LPGLGRIVRRPAGNPGQGEGQQGAAIGDDKKPLVFDGALLGAVVSSQLPVKDFASKIIHNCVSHFRLKSPLKLTTHN
jgi:hypothetical protein